MSEEKKEKKEEKKPTNFDVISEKICPGAVDTAYMLNTVLSSRKKRCEAAREVFGDASPCAFCWKHHVEPKQSEHECSNYLTPLNMCRYNMLRWLGLEAGKKVPRAWTKEVEE